MKPVEIRDLLSYRFLSGLRYAPGCRRAAFVVKSADEEENTYEARLWLYENGGLRQLTDLGREASFTWLDENRLIFPAVRSAREKKQAESGLVFTSLYVLDVRGGEALPFCRLPFRAKRIEAPDPAHLIVTAETDKTAPALWQADDAAQREALEAKQAEQDYEVLDELPFWSNGAGFTNGSRQSLFLVDLEPFQIRPLVQAPSETLQFTVSGDEVIFAHKTWQRGRHELAGFTLSAANWRTGARREILEEPKLRLEGIAAVEDRVYLFATAGARYGLNENAWVYVLEDGSLRLLRQEEYCLYNSVGTDCRLGGGRQGLAFGPDWYHLTTRGGSAVLHRLRPDGTDEPVYAAEGSMDCFDVGQDEILFIGLYDMRPQELYRLDRATGRRERVSRFNDEALADRFVAKPKPITVRSGDLDISGWILEPEETDSDRRCPAVFVIHGGPKTVYGPVFVHEMQVWASSGYYVFFCNPKGSDGGDNDFMDIRGDYGGTDYQNIMDFAAGVLDACPRIDPARVCVTGGSYGGFMTNWIIGHTDRFCCAASQRSISNWLSFWGVADIGFFFAADQTGGDLFDDVEKLWAQSPLKYAKNVKTPTLFIHSEEDYRCPLEQGLQMYAALACRGVETRLCLFRGENHELSRSGKPLHRLRRLQEITDWFEKYSKPMQPA